MLLRYRCQSSTVATLSSGSRVTSEGKESPWGPTRHPQQSVTVGVGEEERAKKGVYIRYFRRDLLYLRDLDLKAYADRLHVAVMFLFVALDHFDVAAALRLTHTGGGRGTPGTGPGGPGVRASSAAPHAPGPRHTRSTRARGAGRAGGRSVGSHTKKNSLSALLGVSSNRASPGPSGAFAWVRGSRDSGGAFSPFSPVSSPFIPTGEPPSP